MKLLSKIAALFVFAVLTTGCQDVIQIELPESGTFLVVDGIVRDSLGTEVTLSTSAGYFDQGETPRINTANVFLFENDTLVAELERDSLIGGRYFSTYTGSIGNDYYIEIDIPEDEPNFYASTWRSTVSTMRRIFEIDSMNVRLLNRRTNPQAFSEGVYALAYFQEPEGRGDNYRLTRWKNDSLYTREISLFPDVGADGFYFGDPEQIGGFQVSGALDPGDTITFTVASLTADHFEYLSLLGEQVFQVGSTFDPPPAPLYGNVYNVDNKDELAFGYFGASALVSASVSYNP